MSSSTMLTKTPLEVCHLNKWLKTIMVCERIGGGSWKMYSFVDLNAGLFLWGDYGM